VNSFFKSQLSINSPLQIIKTLIETCHKALYNAIARAIRDKEMNKRLMDKFLHVSFIVEKMKRRGESEETIQEVDASLSFQLHNANSFPIPAQ